MNFLNIYDHLIDDLEGEALSNFSEIWSEIFDVSNFIDYEWDV